MSFYYPDNEDALYYVEFERGGHKNEFTVFKRQWFFSKKQLEEIKANDPDAFAIAFITNEGHPWNIFTATYGPLGSMPDERWVRFMVDALNEKVKNDISKEVLNKAVLEANIIRQRIAEAKKSA